MRSKLEWTYRDWLGLWFLLACGLVGLLHASDHLVLGLISLAGIGVVPFRRGPMIYRRWLPYVAMVPFAVWWSVTAVSVREGGSAMELLFVPGWYFLCLGAIHLWSIRQGGIPTVVVWCACASGMLAGLKPDFVTAAVVAAQALLAALVYRRLATGRWRQATLGSLVAVVALGAGLLAGAAGTQAIWKGRTTSVWPVEHGGNVLKGFSPVSTLGTFTSEYSSASDDEVALRVWTRHPPMRLRGMVFETYFKGSWRQAQRGVVKQSEAYILDFGVFCHRTYTEEPPEGWVSPAISTTGHSLTPLGTSCVAAVADSAKVWSSGVYAFDGGNLGRGWSYVLDPAPDTLHGKQHLDIPAGWSRLLDSTWKHLDSMPGSPEQKIADWFQGSFEYSLVPGVEPGTDPLRRFFQRRQGYCEYFASAAVLLLRAKGIPARYVTGFAYPEPAASKRWWVFRRGNAHAWVERFDRQRGWVEFDPTPVAWAHKMERPFWNRYVETVQGEMVRIWNLIRDGNWRKALIFWEEWSTKAMEDSRTWWLLGLAAGIWLALRTLARRRAARTATTSARVLKWQKELEWAEGVLRKQGFVRRGGETVGDWLGSLPDEVDPNAKERLEEYQKERFKSET